MSSALSQKSIDEVMEPSSTCYVNGASAESVNHRPTNILQGNNRQRMKDSNDNSADKITEVEGLCLVPGVPTTVDLASDSERNRLSSLSEKRSTPLDKSPIALDTNLTLLVVTPAVNKMVNSPNSKKVLTAVTPGTTTTTSSTTSTPMRKRKISTSHSEDESPSPKRTLAQVLPDKQQQQQLPSDQLVKERQSPQLDSDDYEEESDALSRALKMMQKNSLPHISTSPFAGDSPVKINPLWMTGTGDDDDDDDQDQEKVISLQSQKAEEASDRKCVSGRNADVRVGDEKNVKTETSLSPRPDSSPEPKSSPESTDAKKKVSRANKGFEYYSAREEISATQDAGSQTTANNNSTASKFSALNAKERHFLRLKQSFENPHHKYVDGELIYKSGILSKKCHRNLTRHPRLFLLTEAPRLVYVDEEKGVVTGEVELSGGPEVVRVVEKSDVKFVVLTAEREFKLYEESGGARDWAKSVAYVVETADSIAAAKGSWRKLSSPGTLSVSPNGRNNNNAGKNSAFSPCSTPTSIISRHRHLEAAIARFSPSNINSKFNQQQQQQLQEPQHDTETSSRRRQAAEAPAREGRKAEKNKKSRMKSLRKSLPSLFKDVAFLSQEEEKEGNAVIAVKEAATRQQPRPSLMMETMTKETTETNETMTPTPRPWRPNGSDEDEEPTIYEEKEIPTSSVEHTSVDTAKMMMVTTTTTAATTATIMTTPKTNATTKHTGSASALKSKPPFSPLLSFDAARSVFSPPCKPEAISRLTANNSVGTSSSSATSTPNMPRANGPLRSCKVALESTNATLLTPKMTRAIMTMTTGTPTTTITTMPLTPLSANHPYRTPRPRMGTKMMFPNSMIYSYQSSPTIVNTPTLGSGGSERNDDCGDGNDECGSVSDNNGSNNEVVVRSLDDINGAGVIGGDVAFAAAETASALSERASTLSTLQS